MTRIKQTDLRQGWRNPIDTEIDTDDLDPVKWEDVLKWVRGDYSIHLLLDVGGTGRMTVNATEVTKQRIYKLIIIHDKVKVV